MGIFRNSHQAIYFGGLLGLSFFYLVFGLTILDTQNIGWLLQPNNQDSIQHFVGWEFFRHEAWGFPLGIIHNYGAPLATSIVYTDSIPILAILFKCFSAWLPLHFQYFGFWYLICYFLQGIFAWLISEIISDNLFLKIMITCFFLLSPIMLNRTLEHQALVAQWVLLAGFLLYLQPYHQHKLYYWFFLNVITVLIHAYLACMVLLIWVAFLFKNTWIECCLTKKSALFHISITVISLILTGWLAGYFIISLSQGITAGGYSLDSMNCLAPFIPGTGSPVLGGNWSRFFTQSFIFSIAQEDEGFNYFGLGMLFLIVVSSVFFIGNFTRTRIVDIHTDWQPLLVMSAFLIIYSLSNVIMFGPITLIHYSLPSLLMITDIFRASGRFFWPVYYLTMISSFYFLSKIFNKTTLIIVFSLALLLQWVDLSSKLQQLNQHFHQSYQFDELNSAFWQQAAHHYKKIVFIPYTKYPQRQIVHFQQYIHYAALHNMSVNLGYFARGEVSKAIEANRKILSKAVQEKLEADTIYIILKPQMAAIFTNKSSAMDMKERIGNYVLIAPEVKF